MIFWFVKIITAIPLAIFFPCRFIGKKKIPKGKVIIVSNHKSNIDYVYLFTHIWRRQYVLAKKELFKNRFITWFFRSCCGIPVNREKIELSTIKDCLSVLNKNNLLTIFPEGTRNKTDAPILEFKAGASVFAIKAKAPIVPVFIKKKPKIFCLNKIIVGDPIYFDETFKGEEGTQRANQLIKEKMIELYNL